MCFEGIARLSRRVWRRFVRGSREISLVPSLHRASTDALIVQIALMSLIRHHIAGRWRVTDRQQTLHACRGRLLPGSQTHVNVHPGQCHAVNCPRQKRSPRNIRGSRNWSPLPRTAPTIRIRVSVIFSFFQCY